MQKIILRLLLLFSFLLLFKSNSFATHIVGGSLSYVASTTTPGTYTITLTLYRDCTGSALASTATILVDQANGADFSPSKDFTVTRTYTTSIAVVLPPCATAPTSTPCVEQHVYSAVVTNLMPTPGGINLSYGICCRNGGITNLVVDPSNTGEYAYAFIPGYFAGSWTEDFTLPDGTINDGAATAWTRSLTSTPPATAQVLANTFSVTGANGGTTNIWQETFTAAANTTIGAGSPPAWTRTVSGVTAKVNGSNQFEITGVNNGSMTLTTQTIDISAYPGGVDLSIDVSEASNMEAGDNIVVKYSIDGASPVTFGTSSNEFTSATHTAIGLTGSNIQILVTATYDNSSAGEIMRVDNIKVNSNVSMIWTSQSIDISAYASGVYLGAGLTETGTMDVGDNIRVLYSLDGAIPVTFTNDGSMSDDFTSAFANTGPIAGSTVKIYIAVTYDASSPASEVYMFDMVSIYDAASFITNSSPVFNSLPPLLFCKTNNFSLDNSATDNDGDNLVYSFYAPYDDIAVPTYPDNVASFTSVTYSVGYSAIGPFNVGGPNPGISTSSGIMTGVANTLGKFVFGVKVQEYRGGVFLGESTRDYQVTSVSCPPFVPATPTAASNSPICSGSTLSLSAITTDVGATYTWRGPNTYTASVQNPTIPGATTAASGTYSVTGTVAGCTGPAGTTTVTVNSIPTAPVISSNSPVCAGNTLTLSASTMTGATYSWTGPNSFTSSSKNPTIPSATTAASGTYSVAATVNSCGGAKATATITVNAIPIAPTASSNSPICAGVTLTLSASTIAGATYAWTGPNSFSSSLQNPTISASTTAASGTYSVAASVGSCPGPKGTVTVTVNGAPASPIISSNAPVCAGNTLTLSASTVAGATYAWTGPNSFTSSSQKPTIPSATTAATGTYSVVATAGGCPGAAGTATLTVNAIPVAPTVTSNSPICSGNTLTLTASTIAGATYAWTGPNSFTSSSQKPTISSATTAATGTYSVTATVSGCTGPVGTITATVNAPPGVPVIASNSPVCVGNTLSLSASAIAGATYSWTGPNSFTSSSQNPTIPSATTAATGTYSVVANVAGCGGSAATGTATVSPVPASPVATSNSPICAGNTLSLSASAVAGATYSWTGPNSFTSSSQKPTISSATTAATGTYSVVATVAGCGGSPGTIAATVNGIPVSPTAGSNSPICTGANLSLTAGAITGATYAWSGPSSFSSTLQNPTISAATTAAQGTYSVIAIVNSCGSPVGITTTTVYATPAAPTASNNSPVCQGTTLALSASSIAGATYAWIGPNSFSSSSQNPSIAGAPLAASGTYSVAATVNGCTGPSGLTTATVSAIPTAPILSTNAPICAGNTLTLSAATIPGASYSWTGPNGFTSSSQNPTIPSATTAATGTYSVAATVAGCAGPKGTISATINSAPVAPTISSNSPVCDGSTLTLTASTIAGATYAWTGPNSFTSAVQTPAIPGATTAAAGTYSVVANVGGCPGPAGIATLTVNAIPVAPTATSNSPICSGNTLTLTASIITGATYSWSGPNGFTSSSKNPTIPGATTIATGTYSVIATVNGCPGLPGSIAATVNGIPVAPTANNNSPLCAGSDLNLTAGAITGATYAWAGPNSFSSPSQSPTITAATTAASGSYSVTATVSGCTGPVGITTATVFAIPVAPVASSNSPVCQGSTLALSASTVVGAAYAWTGPNSFNSSSKNPVITGALPAASGTYSVTATINSCTGPAGVITATVNATPVVPVAGSNTPVCAGNNLSLTVGSISGATYAWTGPNSFSSAAQNPAISPATIAASGTYSVAATVLGCIGPAGTTIVIVNTMPTVSAASNSPVCQGFSLALSATTISAATYSWTGPNGFTSSSQNPVVSPVALADMGTFSVTATVPGCGTSIAATTSTVNATPAVPIAASNSAICAGNTLSLSAGTIVGATYSWTGPNGFASSSQNPALSLATTAATGTYSVTATVNGCVGPAGTTAAIVNGIPVAPTAGSNSPICVGSNLNLTASAITGATYTWTGPNTFTATAQNPGISGATTAAAGTYSVTATVNGCVGPAGITTATINTIPIAPIAGSNSPVCFGNTLTLTAGTIAGATYAWTGPNSFTSSSQNPSITSAPVAAGGTYSVTATVSGCTGAPGSTVVIINTIPTVTASSNSPVCLGNTVSLSATTVASATYSWTGPNGFTSASQNPTVPSATTAAAGTYSVTTTVGGCPGTVSTTPVIINLPPPAPVASNNSPICSGNALLLSAGSIAGATYSWTGPSAFSSGAQNPIIGAATVTFAGTYSVTATVPGCSVSPAGTTTVTINPAPGVLTPSSNSPVCTTFSLSLSVNTVSNATYSWTGPNGFTSTSQNPSIASSILANAGTYSVTATTPGCSTSSVFTTSVIISSPPSTPVAGNNGPLCEGSGLSLTSSTVTAASYSWTGPNGFTAVIQNPVVGSSTTANTGTYSVTATTAGCPVSGVGTTNVVVNAVPATPTAGSNSPLCVASPLNLTASNIPGAAYSWTGPNGFTSSTKDPIIASVTSADAGTYSVTATINGCTSGVGTTAVIVNSNPPPTSSNSPLCSASTLTLTTTTVGGATYAWTGPNGFSSVSQNPVIANVTSATAGTYSLIVTLGVCVSPVGTVVVIVNPLPATPVIGNNGPLCEGVKLDLTASTVANSTYSWIGVNGFSSSLQNPSILGSTPAATGGYSLTVTETIHGCTSLVAITSATVNATPATPVAGSNTPLCPGQTLGLTASSILGASYAWSGPNSFSSTTQNPSIPSVISANGGTYSVVATVNGCPSSMGTTNVVINSNPPSMGSNSPVCEGTTLSLSTPTVGGATYAWTGPNSFSSVLQNPVVTNLTLSAAGTYSLVVTLGGCVSPPGTTTVFINPRPATPTASSNSPVCEGSTLDLFSNSFAGVTYQWTGVNGFTSTLRNPVITTVTLTASGNYSVTTTETTNGCVSLPGITTATVIARPSTPIAGSNSPLCPGEDLNLTASNIAGAIYSWTGASGFTSTIDNPSILNVTVANAGIYNVTVTDVVTACSSLPGSTSVIINVSPPSVNNDGPVCQGSTLNLSTPLIPTATYSWTGPNGFSSGAQNPFIPGVTTAAAGTYSLVVTTGICISPAGTTTVIVNIVPSAPSPSNSSPVCELGTLNLTVLTIPGATYQWTGVNGFASTLQNPSIAGATLAAAGNYSITATFAGCPPGPAGITSAVVNAAPATPTANSNSPLCPGQTLNLTTNPVGGVSYQWTGASGFTSTLNNPSIANVAASNAGTYSVTITNILTGCSSLPGATSVLINAVPPAVSSNSPVCESLALNLSTPTVPGATYSWTGPNGYNSIAQNPIINNVTLAAAGTYSLVVTLGTCVSPTGTGAVTINSIPAAPAASNNSPVCSGNTLGLTAGTIAGAIYQWTGANGFSSTVKNPSISSVPVLAAGNYSVTVSVLGCPASPAGVTSVVIHSTPSAPTASSNSPLCPGETLSLTATTLVGVNYTWTGPNGFTSPLQNPSVAGVTGASAGTYSVIVTDMVNGCGSTPGTTDVLINSNPPPVTNNSAVCIGSTLILSTTFNSALVYSWTGPNGFTSSSQNPVLPGVGLTASGTYSLVVTLGSCVSPPGITNALVNSPPTAPSVSNNSPVCEFTALKLTANTVSGASYSWSGPNGFISPSQNPIITSVTSPYSGSYSVTITVGGCPASSPGTTNAIVNVAPGTPVASSNAPLCSSATLNLSVNTIPAVNYNWGGPNGFASAIQNPSIAAVTSAHAGVYSVTVTAVTGCTNSDNTTVVIISSTPPVVSNSPLCEGANLALSTDSIFGATYNWTGPDGFTSTQRTNAIIGTTVPASGTYSVIVTAGSCVSETGTGIVSVNAIPTIPIVSSNSPVCEGSSLTLSTFTVAGGAYSWTGPNNFALLAADTAINAATLADEGTYSVTLTVAGCSSLPGILTTTVNTIPIAPAASNNGPVCEGLTLNLNVGTVNGVSYNWTGPNNFLSASQDTSLDHVSLSNAGTYSVTVTDILNGCLGTLTTTTVTINPKPASGFVSSTNCGSDSVAFNDTSKTTSGVINSWNWDFGGGHVSGLQNPSNIYPDFGTYTVTLIVSNDLSCADTVVHTVITSGTPPIATFTTTTGATTYNVNETIDFVSNSANIISWRWNFGDETSDTTQTSQENMSYKYAQSGTYTVTLFVTNGGGCSDSTYLQLMINPSDSIPSPYGAIAVPEAFTPNEDGENDILYVRGGPFKELEFRVYNEWGNLVFETNDQSVGWDGKKKGAKQPTGIYIYTLRGITVQNEQISKPGDVHLLR